MEQGDPTMAMLMAHLKPDDIRYAADHLHHDMSARAIAELRGVSPSTVKRSIAKLYATMRVLRVPRRPRVRTNARHVHRGFTPELLRAL
jgi:IS30 family transposase